MHNDFLTAAGRATTISMGDGDRLARYTVPLYAAPTAAEELDSVRHWRGKHAEAIRERDDLQKRWDSINSAYQRRTAMNDQLQADLTERDEQIDALRQGMKGDYDLDAWLAFVEEAPLLRLDAGRYRWLRSRDLEAISQGGVFAGLTPDNLVLNEETLDQAIDAAMAPDFVELSTHGRLNGVTP